MKKTVKIEYVIDMINAFLLDSEDSLKDAREQMGMLAERILMDTERYNGFRYLSVNDMKDSVGGTTVGIRFDVDPAHRFRPHFEDTDHTRSKYFIS